MTPAPSQALKNGLKLSKLPLHITVHLGTSSRLFLFLFGCLRAASAVFPGVVPYRHSLLHPGLGSLLISERRKPARSRYIQPATSSHPSKPEPPTRLLFAFAPLPSPSVLPNLSQTPPPPFPWSGPFPIAAPFYPTPRRPSSQPSFPVLPLRLIRTTGERLPTSTSSVSIARVEGRV